MQVDESLARNLNEQLTPLPWEKRLQALGQHNRLRTALSTSFSFEDQALLHLIAQGKLNVRIFALDTGRLFEATHEVHQRSREKYQLDIETYYPDTAAVQNFVNANGINSFYDSVDNRLSCCHIRKVEPLARALLYTDVWISGVRNAHSEARSDLPVVEWDKSRGIIKCYPLVDIPEDNLWAFIKANEVPYNPMHEQGFPSIGCAPCTRAIQPGEHPRAGRWWWEQESSQECGLHFKDGKLVLINPHKDGAHA
jgi:phosphoadenosine phosphosulfate reductase